MNLSAIDTKISFLTKANSNDYTNAERLVNVNDYYNKFHSIILSSQDEWDFDDKNNTDYPILTTNLVASQQDYSLPSSILKIKRVEVTYDGTNWVKVEPFDINERHLATDSTSITNDFDTSKPFYDVDSGSLFLYPIPTSNVTAGLKVWIHRSVTEFTSSDYTTGTAVPGFDVLFHQYLPYGASYEYLLKEGRSGADRLKKELLEIEQRAIDYYASKQKDRNWFLKTLTNASDYK